MRYANYLNFSMYHIKLFLSLCEHLNYTKAAEECNVTQPTLSRIIKQLEDTMGIQLFIRNTVRVTMTPAGKSLYNDWKAINVQMEAAILKAYRLQKGRNRMVNLGFCDGINISQELLGFLQQFKQDHPNYEINMIRYSEPSILERLQHHDCDVAIELHPKDKENPFIGSEPLLKGPQMLYMLESNPLCRKEVLSITDLSTQRLLVRAPSSCSDHTEFVHNLFCGIGVEPRFAPYVSNALELSLNIRDSNEGILADRYYVDRYSPYLTGRPIADTESIVWVRWLRTVDTGTDIEIFVHELIQFFRDHNK